jgi:putative ABC transport system permease protein
MSSNATLLLARRSMRARIGRLIAIAIAIILGVAFVVGSFVLADSMRSGFDTLFSDAFAKTDLQVRTALAFGDNNDPTVTRDPVPAELVDTVAAVPGVADADGMLQRNAQIVDTNGDAITTGGAPMFGASWDSSDPDNTIRLLDGEPPSGPDQVAIDGNTADHNDINIGDRVDVITATGPHSFTLSGTVGLGNSDGFGGATFALWDPATAADVLGAEGVYDAIDIRVAEGEDVATVQQRIAEVLPDSVEVVDRETLVDESNSSVNEFIGPIGTGLLIFAFITAFVSAFLINNVFAITIGQRLRELALLRAVGAAGRQVRRLIVMEALLMSVIATVIGIFAGIGVAKLILAIFNAAGAGFPNFGIVLKPTAVIMAFVVGVGITFVAVLVPALRASRIPPVAAMRPELGFDALSTKRLFLGAATTVAGAVMFLIGLLARPGGTPGLILLAGGGAFLLFIGAASVSSTVAKPVTKMIGWPVERIYRAPGQLATENAGRAPRRTSATVAALMIGVALVSASAVFASSLRKTFTDIMDRGVTADWVITAESFMPLPGVVEDTLADVPELSAVSGVRVVPVEIDGDEKQVGAAEPVALEQLVNVGLEEGSWEGLQQGGLFVHQDPANDLGLEVGSTLDLTFQNGVTRQFSVAGIYSDAALVGNWLMSSNVLDEIVSGEKNDFFVAAKTADGVSQDEARRAIEAALADYPQTKIEDTEQFKDSQAAQIDQLLVIITVLLAFAIIIAVLGISITLGLAVFERTREIGLMRAVGMTRRQTRRMVRWEAIIVSTFGAIVGIVLGTLIGVALSLAVPDTIIDGISFSVPTIILILIGAIVAGLIAALYPSVKASRMDVLEAIATE